MILADTLAVLTLAYTFPLRAIGPIFQVEGIVPSGLGWSHQSGGGIVREPVADQADRLQSWAWGPLIQPLSRLESSGRPAD